VQQRIELAFHGFPSPLGLDLTSHGLFGEVGDLDQPGVEELVLSRQVGREDAEVLASRLGAVSTLQRTLSVPEVFACAASRSVTEARLGRIATQ